MLRVKSSSPRDEIGITFKECFSLSLVHANLGISNVFSPRSSALGMFQRLRGLQQRRLLGEARINPGTIGIVQEESGRLLGRAEATIPSILLRLRSGLAGYIVKWLRSYEDSGPHAQGVIQQLHTDLGFLGVHDNLPVGTTWLRLHCTPAFLMQVPTPSLPYPTRCI